MTREEAIEALNEIFDDSEYSRYEAWYGTAMGMAIESLKQPEQKKGKWVKLEDGTWSCSLCHSWISYEQHYYARYCLYCGAKMEGERC